MEDETASSYYQPMPDKLPLSIQMDPRRRIKYWKLVPILKLVHGKRYKREAQLLLQNGLLEAFRGGVAVRYEMKKGLATFDISPDQGRSHLNYLRAKISSNSEDNFDDLVNSIATKEAMIKTKNCLIY